MPTGTLSVAYAIAPAIAYVKRLGVETADLLEPLGLTPAALADPYARIAFDAGIALLDRVADRSGQPDFGLRIAMETPSEATDLHEYLARSSATLGDGLRRVMRFGRVFSTRAMGTVETTRTELCLAILFPRVVAHHWNEFSLTIQLNIARRASGMDLLASRMAFMSSKPAIFKQLEETFRCPIEFNAPTNILAFPRELEQLPLPTHDEKLLRILEPYATERLGALVDYADATDRIRNALFQLIQRDQLSMNRVAHAAGMSVRSMQRALRVDGTSYRALLDEVRRQIAIAHLSAGRLPIATVSQLLGFSEVSAFHRWFRRSTGQTPSELQKGRRKDRAPTGRRALE